MEEAQRLIDLAFCFDAVLFGGYIRDVVVLGKTSYNDIDLMWPTETHKSFTSFSRALMVLFPGVDITHIVDKRSRRYGHKMDVHHICIDGRIEVDCCLYNGSFRDWLNDKSADFTCNLFYRTSTVGIGLRYVPELLNVPNPLQKIMEDTRNKRFRCIVSGEGDAHWVRAVNRALRLVRDGWVLDGEFIDGYHEAGLTTAYRYVMARVNRINRMMKETALDAVSGGLTPGCTERVRRKLFDESDVSSRTEDRETDHSETD